MNNNHSFAAWQTEIISKLARNQLANPLKILDFGAGSGLLTHFVGNVFFNAEITAVDTDEKKIRKVKENPKLKTIHIQTNLPFADNNFDLIYAVNTLHHIAKDKQEFWLRELFRVLKKNGKVIILELNPFNLKALYSFKHNPEEKGAHLLNPYGFKKRLKQFGIPSLQFHYPNWQNSICSKLPVGAVYTLVVHQSRTR